MYPSSERVMGELKKTVDEIISQAKKELGGEPNSRRNKEITKCIEQISKEWKSYHRDVVSMHYGTNPEKARQASREFLLKFADFFPDSRPEYNRAALEKMSPVEKNAYIAILEDGIKLSSHIKDSPDSATKSSIETLKNRLNFVGAQVRHELVCSFNILNERQQEKLSRLTKVVHRQFAIWDCDDVIGSVEPTKFAEAASNYLDYVKQNLPHLHEQKEPGS
ncbi:hypothetical protein [Dictyobacter aurantiacus]|uniref:Uncharacterized protein n=1 Tax=Dictyobacter aurantiacus TaxID=1936993 RepID=A0A401Z9E8_9CHLR|nr:hypothetical protein [Dictyobacter aurantiacus]GCE03497.1 hypothetical protein KDAU_08260 [Dictyobacter aurantiacus]